jgi:hypothetical protein
VQDKNLERTPIPHRKSTAPLTPGLADLSLLGSAPFSESTIDRGAAAAATAPHSFLNAGIFVERSAGGEPVSAGANSQPDRANAN